MASKYQNNHYYYNYNYNNPSFVVVLFSVATLLCFSHSALSDPRISEVGHYCGTHKAQPSDNYFHIFINEMERLQDLVTKHKWGVHSENMSSTTPMYGLAQCFQDLSHTDCLQCFAESRTKLPRCLPSVSARIYLDGCFLRYDNYSFYTEDTDPLRDTVNCTSQNGAVVGDAEKLVFNESVGEVVESVVREAVNEGGGFAVGEGEGVYALAQCWKSVEGKGCDHCLRKAGNEVRGCLPRREGRALNSGCYLRYSTVKFYNQGGHDGEGDDSSRKRTIIAAVLVLAAAIVVLSLAAFTKLSKRKKNNSIEIPSSLKNSSLNYKYETLEKATDYFSSLRKIGQGGAGSVFKGTLPNGKDVAVKRLVFNNRQWVDEFFNEVNLISGMQHKNLVKLLGCSIEGPESLIMYEYLPNKSLDQFIFEKDKTRILKWKQRFDIILGTAEGLAYLHGGSETRIIHRDIKSSNVLLDENLNPKIADFGLARCFGTDKTHLSTGIAGTLGYMAPEYLIQGQLTDKADVYSFGVLVLEIVCGWKNNVFREDSGSLLQTVWKLYQSKRLAEAVDPCLEDDFPAAEASRVFQIGLLCTQASPSLRPSMTQVVCMLSNSNLDVPIPKQPPFLNSKLLDQTPPLGFSTDISSSNAFKVGVSNSSFESSSTRSLIRPSRSEEKIMEA
uniref:Cysteine-rich receptor-like protein kinase 42 n=2 Tax=Cajanus cajan TaxID=3821 RepID=A0A151SJ44_CAJCA|nr:Cysteine-rich receptor-like protein kinase 42 [Cajanus cajan]